MNLKEEIVNALGIEPSLLIAHIIAVTLIFIVFYFFVWKKAVSFLKKREDDIRENIESAAELNRISKENAKNTARKLEKASLTAMQIVNEAKATAINKSDEIISKADKEANNILENARVLIAVEKKTQRKKREEQAIYAAFKLSQALLKREVKEDDHKKLIASFTNDLKDPNEK